MTVWPIWVKTTEVKHQTLPSLARSEQLSSSAEGDCKHLSSQPGWCINIRSRAHSLIIIIQLEEDLEHLRSCAESWSRLYSVTSRVDVEYENSWIYCLCQAPPRSLIYPIHQTHLQITIKPRSVYIRHVIVVRGCLKWRVETILQSCRQSLTKYNRPELKWMVYRMKIRRTWNIINVRNIINLCFHLCWAL